MVFLNQKIWGKVKLSLTVHTVDIQPTAKVSFKKQEYELFQSYPDFSLFLSNLSLARDG